LVAENTPADVAALSALPLAVGTVESARQALVQKIGENISIRRFARFTSAAKLYQYLHGGGRIVATVEMQGGDDQTGKDVAMHIAASAAPGAVRPVCVSRGEVPTELIDKERAIFMAQAADSGKPPEIVAKMIEGRINKYLGEVTLLGQPFVKNPDETVEQYLKAKGATVKRFALYVVGEGIEKKKDDFAAEVAAMAKA
jgi:elongation factor Ts